MNPNSETVIFSALHKPEIALLSSSFQLVHCGRETGSLFPLEYKWMKENSCGDNTNDNISILNPYFCEMTGIYWIWKNLHLFSHYKRIGFCHYRRFFINDFNFSDVVAPVHFLLFSKSIRSQFNSKHSFFNLDCVADYIDCYEFREGFLEYISQRKGYFFNMFIFEKNLFVKYCQYIFPILFSLWRDLKNKPNCKLRCIGYIAERLTGGFLYSLKKSRQYSFCESAIYMGDYLHFSKKVELLRMVSSVPCFTCAYSGINSIKHLIGNFK